MPVYAPWDSGRTFDVGSPPGTYNNQNYYGHCCLDSNGNYIQSEYYAVDINKPSGANDCGETIRATNSGTVTKGNYGSIPYATHSPPAMSASTST